MREKYSTCFAGFPALEYRSSPHFQHLLSHLYSPVNATQPPLHASTRFLWTDTASRTSLSSLYVVALTSSRRRCHNSASVSPVVRCVRVAKNIRSFVIPLNAWTDTLTTLFDPFWRIGTRLRPWPLPLLLGSYARASEVEEVWCDGLLHAFPVQATFVSYKPLFRIVLCA